MSAAQRRDGWTSTYTASSPETADHALTLCEAWRRAKPGRETRKREGRDGEKPFVIEIRENA